MSASSIFLAAVAASIATAATIAVPASAEMVSTTTEVGYGDLNLASTDGAEALKARVARAARQVCAVTGDKSLQAAQESHACTKSAMAQAMPQVELALANAGTQLAEAGRVTVAAH